MMQDSDRWAGLDPQLLLEIRSVGAPVFDPAGRSLLLTETYFSPAENRQESRILRVDLSSGACDALTFGPMDTSPRFSPDGSHIAFLRRKDGRAQIHVMPADGGEAHAVTDLSHGVRELCWLDGNRIVLTVPLKDGRVRRGKPPDSDDPYTRFNADVRRVTSLYHKLDGEGFFPETRRALAILDVCGGAIEVLQSGEYDCLHPVASPDGSRIAFLSYRRPDAERRPGLQDIYLYDLGLRGARRLTDGRLGIVSLAFAEDGEAVYFAADDPVDLGYGQTRLYAWREGEGACCISRRLDRSLGDQSGSDIGAPSELSLVARGGGVYAQVSDEGRVGIWQISDDDCRPVLQGDRVIFAFDHHPARGFAIAYADFRRASAIAIVDAAGERELISGSLPESLVRQVREPRHFTARADGGPELDCWLLLPDGSSGQLPLVVEVHGGPMSMYGMRLHLEFQLLRAAGYAVLFTNPRGSQGYGEAFCNAIVGRWGDKDFKDVMAAIDEALIRFPQLSPLRLGIAGGSYGGFMVNWAISHSRRFRAAVTMRSVVNRMSAMGSADVGFERVPQYGPLWWEDPSPYLQQSPLTYASEIRTPLLIEHQEQDMRLPIEQGEQLFTALRLLGRRVEMLRYPGESHGMSRTGKPWHRVHRYRAILDWFNRYL